MFSKSFFLFFLLQTSAYAGVFKCVKENGAVYYNDKPCSSGLKERIIILDKVPSSKVVRSRKNKILGQDPTIESTQLKKIMKQTHFDPADQAEYIKMQQAVMLKHELAVDDGSYEMTAEEKKSMKILEERQAKHLAEQRRKEVIKQAKSKERNRLAKIAQNKRIRKRQQVQLKSYKENRLSKYVDYLKSKESSGAMMTAEEENWRDLDKDELGTQAEYNESVNTVGTEEYKEVQQELVNRELAKQAQMRIDRELNSRRYEGNDIHK